jgi:hypothetical protein
MSKVPKRNCGTPDICNELLKDPKNRQSRIAIETATLAFGRVRPIAGGFARAGIVKVPVVVHVVHNGEEQNISSLQVFGQINVLNQDYRMLNVDVSKVPEPFKSLAADARIEFQLAKRDPSGNQTTGITRTPTNKDAFSVNDDDVKSSAQGGKDAWDTSRYMNIWVCNMNMDPLGYATPPGFVSNPAQDGVVIDYKCFGLGGTAVSPFDKGRTCTHEAGHYFDLYHIWGATEPPEPGSCDGTDNVSDTPNQKKANFNKPHFPLVTCNNGPNGDMFMNYMDYTDDDSMYMFTHGQVLRMQAALNGPRAMLQQSPGLIELPEPGPALRETLDVRADGGKLVYNGAEYVEVSKLFS